MKVLLINGSPRPHGCTYTALKETEKTLNEAGIETEIFHIGAKAIQGCTDCGACAGGKPCVFDKEDEVVAIARKKSERGGRHNSRQPRIFRRPQRQPYSIHESPVL